MKHVNTWGPLETTIAHTSIFQVPENIFFDEHDGFTRNLTLRVTDSRGAKVISLLIL